jgi:hypothetical protein
VREALSTAIMRNIRQNLFLAFVYNAVGIPIAAGVLYPFLSVLAKSHDRERGHDVQLGFRHHECIEASKD